MKQPLAMVLLAALSTAVQAQATDVAAAPGAAHPMPSSAVATREQGLAALRATTTAGLKAKAATLEAVLRSSPSDSSAFQSATDALLLVNAELARRAALK